MKRKIIASLLGVAGSLAMVASSHAQGSVNFISYASDVNAPVTFAQTQSGNGVTGVAGGLVGSEFTAALMYSLNGGVSYTLLDQVSAGAGGSYPTAFLGTDRPRAPASFLGGACRVAFAVINTRRSAPPQPCLTEPGNAAISRHGTPKHFHFLATRHRSSLDPSCECPEKNSHLASRRYP